MCIENKNSAFVKNSDKNCYLPWNDNKYIRIKTEKSGDIFL